MIRHAALYLLTLIATGAAAQTTLYYREGQRVEPQEVRRILDNVTPSGATRSRSIRVLGDAPAQAAANAQAADPAAPSSLTLPVQFDFDSVTISSAAREQLDALAEGIKLLPPERLVVIEGHTDARGTDDYNQQLSQRRAAAVKNYLVQEHGIAADRLRDTGVGKRQPVPDTDPFAGVNRRVQFRGG